MMGLCYIYEKLYLSKPVGPMLKLEESLKVLYGPEVPFWMR